MRLRISREKPDARGAKDLLVLPYEFGMALEYPGIVECWVDSMSIHNNTRNNDRGATLWVGNHDDSGGLRLTGYSQKGKRYGRLGTELFNGGSGGDLRLAVHDPTDAVEVRTGPGNDDRPVFRISQRDGLELRSDSDTPFHVSQGGELRAKGRVIAAGGLAVGTAEPATGLGPVRHRVPLHGADGKLLGYLPVHGAA